MRRGLTVGCSTMVVALMNAIPALADPPTGPAPNPHQHAVNSAIHSGQCLGLFSAEVIHNGTVVREQAHSSIGREGYVDLAHACIPA